MSYYTLLAFEIAFGTWLINFFLLQFNLYKEECDFYHLNPIGKTIFMSFELKIFSSDLWLASGREKLCSLYNSLPQ